MPATRHQSLLIALGLVCLSLCCGQHLFAQDTLFYTNGKHIVGQVEEVGLDLVRYRTASGAASVLIVVEKRDLARVKLAGGQEFFMNPVLQGPVAKSDFLARVNAVSLDIMSPAFDHVTVGYERRLARHINLNVKVGYIGLGVYRNGGPYYNEQDRGALIKAGVKFILPSGRRRIPTARDEHPLNGWYFRPELIFSDWMKYQTYVGPYGPEQDSKRNYTSAALQLSYGRQWVLGERFIFDMYASMGYGVQWRDGQSDLDLYRNSYSSQEYAYSHFFLTRYSPFTLGGGVLFGYIF